MHGASARLRVRGGGCDRLLLDRPALVRGVGACRDGTQTCQQDGEFLQWGPCEGQVLDCGDAGADASGGSDGSGDIETGGMSNEDSGLPNPLSVSCRRLAVVGAGRGVCVLASDGTVRCGNYPLLQGDTVVSVPNTSGSRCLSGGEDFLCVVTSTGGAACWGNIFQPNVAAFPVLVPGLESGVIDVAAGETHACVLLSTGAVQCWGSNFPGEFDKLNPGRSWPTSPTTVPLRSRAVAITTGDGFSCAILASGGQVECWGSNQDGELGSAAPSDGTTPLPVALPAPAVGVWADQATSPCALLQDGSVWCWGLTGNWPGYRKPIASPPAPETGFAARVQSLTTGGEWGMSCALLTTGAVQCWGNAEVFLGDGDAAAPPPPIVLGMTEYSARPVNVLPAGSGAVEIRSGDVNACALLASGEVTCWGAGPVPTVVPGL
jgi:hypothetical protein